METSMQTNDDFPISGMLSMKTYIQTNVDFPIPVMLNMKTYMETNVDVLIPGMLSLKTSLKLMLIFPCNWRQTWKLKCKLRLFFHYRDAKHENLQTNVSFPMQGC